jgi:hypothetical protein
VGRLVIHHLLDPIAWLINVFRLSVNPQAGQAPTSGINGDPPKSRSLSPDKRMQKAQLQRPSRLSASAHATAAGSGRQGSASHKWSTRGVAGADEDVADRQEALGGDAKVTWCSPASSEGRHRARRQSSPEVLETPLLAKGAPFQAISPTRATPLSGLDPRSPRYKGTAYADSQPMSTFSAHAISTEGAMSAMSVEDEDRAHAAGAMFRDCIDNYAL